MRAGPLRHRVIFQRPDVVRNSYGEEITTWVLGAELWCQIEPISGRELLQAAIDNPEQMVRMFIRYAPALLEMTTKWRAIWKTQVFDIVSVRDIGFFKSTVEVMARRGRTAG